MHEEVIFDQKLSFSNFLSEYPGNDGTNKVDWRDCKDATKKNSDNDNDGPDKTLVPASQNCDTWSYDLDIKLAAVNAKTELLNSQYDDAQTNEEIDKYNAQVDKVGAEVDVVNAELDRFNAECATTPPTTQSTTHTIIAVQPEAGVSDDCRSSGFEDGMNSGFNVIHGPIVVLINRSITTDL